MDKTRDKYNIKFKNRTASNTSDKRIADAYNKAGAFDVNLITSDDKVVAAHRFVLSMYSKHLAGILRDLGSNGLIIIPVHLSHEILQKIVQMMYFREVTVPRELSLEMNDAIKFLKIDDTITVDSATLEDNNNPFKEPTAPPPKRKTAPPNQTSGPMSQQIQQKPPQQKLAQAKPMQSDQMRPKPTQTASIQANGIAMTQMESITPGKRPRSQSHFIEREVSSRGGYELPCAQTATKKSSGLELMAQYSNLSITKVTRPKKSSDSKMQSSNPSPVQISNGVQMVEKKGIMPNVQPQPQQQQVRPAIGQMLQQIPQKPPQQQKLAQRPTPPPTPPSSNVAMSMLMKNPALTIGVTGNTVESTLPTINEKQMQPNEQHSIAMETDLDDEMDIEKDAPNAMTNGNVEMKEGDVPDIFPELRENTTSATPFSSDDDL